MLPKIIRERWKIAYLTISNGIISFILCQIMKQNAAFGERNGNRRSISALNYQFPHCEIFVTVFFRSLCLDLSCKVCFAKRKAWGGAARLLFFVLCVFMIAGSGKNWCGNFIQLILPGCGTCLKRFVHSATLLTFFSFLCERTEEKPKVGSTYWRRSGGTP